MSARAMRRVIVAAGLAISALLVARGQTGGDQLRLLALGWRLAVDGDWVQHGNPTSSGGASPGGATSLAVALPLLVWRDHRAPAASIALLHLLAWLILDRVLRSTLSPADRVLFAVAYWLGPWRLYHSGFLWNPNFMFFFGAVHLAACWRQRRRPELWSSLVLAASIGVAFQIHSSAVLLGAATLALWLARHVRLSWQGLLGGSALVALSLVPWALEVRERPALAPVGRGAPFHGLLEVLPVVRGVGYWLRFESAWLNEKMTRLDFTHLSSPPGPAWLGPAVGVAVVVAGLVTAVVALAANLRLWRRPRTRLRRLAPGAGGRAWLAGYVRWTFVAGVAVFALSPVTIMSWHVLVIFHASVLALVLWASALMRSRHARLVRRAALAWGIVHALVGLALSLGSSRYRCTPPSVDAPALRHDHPMLHELGILECCPRPTDDPDGWWPENLPPDA